MRRFVAVVFAAAIAAIGSSSPVVATPSAIGATLTVTTTSDAIATDGQCSLREAITAANTNATVRECAHSGVGGTDIINFAIKGTGAHTIAVASALPLISGALVINGYSQSGASVNTAPSTSNAVLAIVLNGSTAPAGTDGLHFKSSACGAASPHCLIKGLVIQAFPGDGIELASTNNVDVFGNFIGTNATGTADVGNGANGVRILAADNNDVGDTTTGVSTRNLISGNNANGVLVDGSNSTNNVIEQNLIGTNAAGNADLGNSADGVRVTGAGGTLIGGSVGTTPLGSCTGRCNVISGNNSDGVEIDGTTVTNTVRGNYIGVDVTGEVKLGNTTEGVRINAASNQAIGSATAGARNIISGNGHDGVGIQDPSVTASPDNNSVTGNFIGTDTDGNQSLGNTFYGVIIYNLGSGNQIGGTAGTTAGGNCTGECNVIAGNGADGIVLNGYDSNTMIEGNHIGVDITGALDRGNAGAGVRILSTTATVGGGTVAAINVISGNDGSGIDIFNDANVVSGNFIGTNQLGTADVGNTMDGVHIGGGNDNTIGGTIGTSPGGACSGVCNVISGNNSDGVELSNGAADNTIAGNLIGADQAGTGDLGNSSRGVFINDAPNNTIGGSIAAARNVIAGNSFDGVRIEGASATGNSIMANFIGVNTTGAAPLNNGVNGVYLNGSPGNFVGGTGHTVGVCDGECNLISGNSNHGIAIDESDNNKVRGNFIGTNLGGTAAIENANDGVLIFGVSDGNVIGGPSNASRNLISGNQDNGITLAGSPGPSNTTIARNFIGTDVTGATALANGVHGVAIAGGASSATIGLADRPNRIAFNGSDGVSLSSGGSATGIRIRANFIFGNGGLGIDLGNDGVTANDGGAPPDADTGPNGLQNFPVLTSANSSTDTIQGTLTSTPNTSFTLDFFMISACDASGNGEGRTYLGSKSVTTDANGAASFSATTATDFSAGKRITATATASGSTSEFSACFTAT
jgi:titin